MAEQQPHRRRKRWILGFAALVVAGLLVAAFLFPYLLKRYIEDNSEAWVDRKITIGSIRLNPFNGTYAVHDLVCYEPRSEQVFVSFAKLGIKGSVIDGLRNAHWVFHDAELREPYVHVVHNGDSFNFSDLLEMGGDSAQVAEEAPNEEAEFTVTGIALSGGRIDYLSDLLHAPLQLVDLGVSCTRITSRQARMDFLVGVGMPGGTRLDGGFMIDTDSTLYAVDAHLREFDLAMALPYLQDFFDAGDLKGRVDLDFTVEQNYADSSGPALSARMGLREFSLQGPEKEHLLSVASMNAKLDTLYGDRFDLSVVDVDGMDAHFAFLADGTDNWTRLLKLVPDSTSDEEGAMVLDASESNYFVLLADYISYLGTAFTGNEYTADSLVFRNGRLLFEDHSMPRSFRYDITDIDMRAQRFDSDSRVAPISAKARLNDVGRVDARAEFDPNDFRNVAIDLRVDSLLLSHMDPYTRWYAAHPTADGILSYTSTTNIRNGVIDSQNTMYVDRLTFGKKVDGHAPDIYLLPLRLAAGLLKDAKGVVELDVPVQGDLRDPQFKVWPIVWQILKNLVVKAVMAPANLLARAFDGADEKDLEQVRFQELQGHLESPQRKSLTQLAKALEAKQDLRVDLVPLVDSLAEAGELALFKAKCRYLFPQGDALTAADSTRALGLTTRDSSFVRWMDGQLPGTAEQPMTARSMALIGNAASMKNWAEVEYARRENVMQALLAAGVVPERVRFRQGSPAELAAYKGAPGYRFIYDVLD
jgi:hypothetical protein